MRVHLHTDCYWFSGSETTLLLLADALFADPSVDVTFTYRAWPEYERGLRSRLPGHVTATPIALPDPANVKERLTGSRRGGAARALRGAITVLPFKQGSLAYDVAELTKRFRGERPDLLHVNNGGMPGAISCNAAVIAGRRAGVPAIVEVINNIAYPYRGPGRWLDYPVDRQVVKAVDRFVTGSAVAGEALRSVLHLPATQHTVIPNGVERREPTMGNDDFRREWDVPIDALVIASVARLEVRKGHRHLFGALAHLPDELRHRVVLVVAGDGPEREALEQVVERGGLQRSVRFLGPHPDPWSIYAAADVVALPSIGNEDLPIVVIEAMAAGRPVVASRVAGVPSQIVEGKTGLIVPPADEKALADALAHILSDPALGAEMGAAGRDRYESTYTPEVVVGQYRDLYRTLLHEPRST